MSYFDRFPNQAAVERAKAGHTPNTGHEDEEDKEGEKGKKKPFGGNKAKPFKRVKTRLKFVS